MQLHVSRTQRLSIRLYLLYKRKTLFSLVIELKPFRAHTSISLSILSSSEFNQFQRKRRRKNERKKGRKKDKAHMGSCEVERAPNPKPTLMVLFYTKGFGGFLLLGTHIGWVGLLYLVLRSI